MINLVIPLVSGNPVKLFVIPAQAGIQREGFCAPGVNGNLRRYLSGFPIELGMTAYFVIPVKTGIQLVFFALGGTDKLLLVSGKFQ